LDLILLLPLGLILSPLGLAKIAHYGARLAHRQVGIILDDLLAFWMTLKRLEDAEFRGRPLNFNFLPRTSVICKTPMHAGARGPGGQALTVLSFSYL
jgi:hypothetical protein